MAGTYARDSGALSTASLSPIHPVQTSAFRAACVRYARLRRMVYDHVQHDARASGAVPVAFRLADIDEHALAAWSSSWARSRREIGGWDWEAISRPLLRRPAGLPLALWCEDRLIAFAAGRFSRRRSVGQRLTLSLSFIEADPDPHHPLRRRVALIVTSTAVVLAVAVGARRVRLVDPLPGVWDLYEGLGFTLAFDVQLGLYYERRISPDEQNPY
jgi:hypothetical protein